MNNAKLNNEIIKLNNDLNIEKNNNLKLSQKIQELEKIINIKGEQTLIKQPNLELINKEQNLICELNEKLKNLNNYLNYYLNNNLNNNLNKEKKINELYEEIRIKDKIISNYPIKLSEGEKLLSIIFVSSDQKLHYSIICKNTDKFSKIENMLYDIYPEYMESENYFVVNGKKINRYKSLELNSIKNNDIIMLKSI